MRRGDLRAQPHLRALILLLALAGGYAPHARAQSPTAEAQAPFSPASLAAARDFYRAILIDAGPMKPLFEAMSAPLQASMTSSPFYAQASPEHRAALDAYVASLPAWLHAEFEAALAARADAAAPRIAALMTAEELSGATEFLLSPAAQPLWRALVNDVASGQSRSRQRTFPDWSLTPEGRAFAASAPGLALQREEEALSAILVETSDAVLTSLAPRIQRGMAQGACDALEEECPPHMRAMLERP